MARACLDTVGPRRGRPGRLWAQAPGRRPPAGRAPPAGLCHSSAPNTGLWLAQGLNDGEPGATSEGPTFLRKLACFCRQNRGCGLSPRAAVGSGSWEARHTVPPGPWLCALTRACPPSVHSPPSTPRPQSFRSPTSWVPGSSGHPGTISTPSSLSIQKPVPKPPPLTTPKPQAGDSRPRTSVL